MKIGRLEIIYLTKKKEVMRDIRIYGRLRAVFRYHKRMKIKSLSRATQYVDRVLEEMEMIKTY